MKYDVFIEGETVDLCVPVDDKDVIRQWSSWFNKADVTRYLSQGIHPNTINDQQQYFNNMTRSDKKVICLIKPKHYDKYIGVAGLSEINHVQRQCSMAIVIGERYSGKDSVFIGLESKALLTQHAMEVVGMERIKSLQAMDLKKWQNLQILFGYQVEGILRNRFRKGKKVHDMIVSSCLLEDYEKILDYRGGNFWPGKSKMFELMRGVPRETLIDKFTKWLPNEHEKYWNQVYK